MDSCPKSDKEPLMSKGKKTHFFKIILDGNIRDGKLYFPRRFIRNYGNDLSSPVILKVCSGAKWEVELVKHDGKIWLQNGWKEFQKYYSLAHGSFLVFEYDQGNCDFNVIIFDKSATEIDYPVSIINGDTNYEPNPEKAESNVSVEILTHFSPSLKTRKKSPLPFSFSPPNKKIKLENSTGQVEARKGGVSCQKQTRDEVVDIIKPLNAGEKAKNLPKGFVIKHTKKSISNIILQAEGREWPVKLIFDHSHRGWFSAGWTSFAKENSLQVGDVCIFELVNSKTLLLKVSIFRNVSYSHLRFHNCLRMKSDFL
eukprot:XP_015573422.1 B3 domain-containing transcription factor VRN1 [Ricinus communis]